MMMKMMILVGGDDGDAGLLEKRCRQVDRPKY